MPKTKERALYSFAGAAMTVYHRLGGYHLTAVKAKNSKIEVLAGLAPPEVRERMFHASHQAPGGLLAIPWCTEIVPCSWPSSIRGVLLLCVSLSQFLPFLRTPVVSGDYLCDNSSFKHRDILDTGG